MLSQVEKEAGSLPRTVESAIAEERRGTAQFVLHFAFSEASVPGFFSVSQGLKQKGEKKNKRKKAFS